MGNVCSLNQDKQFKQEFIKIVNSLEGINDKQELEDNYIRALKNLRNTYSEVSDDNFFDSIKDIVSSAGMIWKMRKNGNLASVLSQDYQGELTSTDTNYIESTLDNESKFDNIDSTEQEKNEKEAIKQNTLASYFPMSSDARLAFEQKFRNDLIERFFFSGDNTFSKVNITQEEMDKAIKEFRNSFEQNLDNYVEQFFPKDYSAFKQFSIKDKLNYFKQLLDNKSLELSPVELLRLPTINTMSDGNLKKKLLAYTSYIAMNHFDELVNNAFGDSVKVLYKGNYDTKELKYKINLGNKNARGWNDQSEDVDETDEIGSIIRLFMESLNMYDPKNGALLPFKMSFQDVKSGIGGIMKVFNRNHKRDGTPLRQFSLDSISTDTLKRFGIDQFYKDGWEDIVLDELKGKTLGELLAKTKKDPALYSPLLFGILAVYREEFFDRYQEKQAVYSIWKNIFDYTNTNSLLRRMENSGGINLDGLDLYTFVNTLFVNIENIPMIEYQKDSDNKISTIQLQQNTSNSRLNSQKYIWQANYNAELPQSFKTFTIKDFGEGNSTTIKINNSEVSLEVKADNGNVKVVPKLQNGKSVEISTLTPELSDFLSEVFNKRINNDFLDIFTNIGGTLGELINIAGTILYNYKVGKYIYQKIQSQKGTPEKEVYDAEIAKFYSENPPSPARGQMQPELTNRTIYTDIRRFALALDIQQGYSGDTTAKDGQRKQISLVGLSSLASKYLELVYNNNLSDPDSIIKDFRIIDTIEEVEFMRDYSQVGNNKQATSFSESEFFEANFIQDFYGGQLAVAKDGTQSDISKDSYEDCYFRIMGPVVSDKSKLPKLRFNWKTKVTLPSGEIKAFYQLTTQEILDLQKEEFGKYYQGVYDRIKSDLENILPYVQRILPGAVLDYDNDYELFNQQCTNAGLNPKNVLHDAVALFQTEARRDGVDPYLIRLTEKMHYIWGKDGSLHNNPSLYHQLSIYGREVPKHKIRTSKKYLNNLDTNTINETPEQAQTRLNLQLITELLQNNIRIRLGDDTSKVNDNATWAAQHYNENGVWRNGNTIVIAKINNGYETINIQSLNDFENWNDYRRLRELDNSPEYNISNPRFNLLKTLNALNIISKYNLFKFKDAQNAILPYYLEEELGQTRDIDEVLRDELRTRHPNWGNEAIERHVQEEKSKLSEEDIKIKKAKYQMNLDINIAITDELDGDTPDFDYNEQLKTLQKYLEDNPESEQAEKIKNRINSSINIQLNPEIERYQALNNWLGESYQLTSVGTFISHPGDNNASTIYNYEYGNFGQQVKRNVSHTATKHREVQNSLKGIRRKLRMTFIGDEKDSAITFKGDYKSDEIAVHNGATFYNGTMVDLDNNSLGADAMGEDKKPFIHFIDPKTGIGGIVKTAGFAISNNYIQSSERGKRMNKKMNHTIKWTDTLKFNGYNDPFFNWLEDFNKKPLDFSKGWYVQKGDKFYHFTNPTIDENGITRVTVKEVLDNGEGKNAKPVQLTFGYSNGNFVAAQVNENLATNINGEEIPNFVATPINSNWELWNVFGGAYSCHFDSKHKLTSINDNGSFKGVNYVMNHTGIVLNPNMPVVSQTNVLQVVKESQIDMIPTTEAGKFGATNINSTQLLDDDDYVPTVMECFSDDFGEQLDAEHTAEGGHVSLMTQVINALGARGYSKQDAEECYQALQDLAEQSFEEAFGELDKLNQGLTEDSEQFKTAVANIMLQTLKNVSISDGNILSAIANGLKRFQRFGSYSQLEGSFPISSPQIFANLFSKLASNLEKSSIRLKFDGGMLVLNPSNGIFKIINGKLEGKISENEIKLVQSQNWNNPLTKSSQIKFGRYYYMIYGVGPATPKLIDSLEDFYEVKNAMQNGAHVIEAVQKGLNVILNDSGEMIPEFKNYQPLGRDLATYDAEIVSIDGNTYSLWETDIVRCLFDWDKENGIFKSGLNQTNLEKYWNQYVAGDESVAPNLIQELEKFGISTEVTPETMGDMLQASFQRTLDSISNGTGNKVIINNTPVVINKNLTTVTPYECILPMIYKTTFGLRSNDTIGDIVNDEYFFVRRYWENSKSKFYSKDNTGNIVGGKKFDFELKRTDGNHIYIASSNRKVLGSDIKIIPEIVDGVMYRVDSDGNKMYQIPSKVDESTGQLVPNCQIIKTLNGTEVIKTDDLLSILEQADYNQVNLGDFSVYSDINHAKNVLLQLEQSTNKVAQSKVNYIKNAVKRKIETNKKGLENNDSNFKIIADNEQLAQAYLNFDKEFENLGQIFEDTVGKNALIHHELFTVDASNQQKLLDGLLEAIDTNSVNEFLTKYPHMKSVLDFAQEQYTSFLTSLEAVVSRTPAQSHQSFMAMRVAGFDSNTTNSIYVSRMQLYLQGSDFDIDKANVLGLKFYNGRLVTWSPYYDLREKHRAEESEKLPFPSGKSLNTDDLYSKIPFDVIEKNYVKGKGVNSSGQNFVVFTDDYNNSITATEISKGVWGLSQDLGTLNQNTYLLQHAIIKNFGQFTIINNGVLDENTFKFDDSGKFVELDKNNDYRLYLSSLDLSKDGDYFTNLSDLGTLIRTFTKLGTIPSEFVDYINIVNKHNLHFIGKDGKRDKRRDKRKRDALYNFISIKSKNITKNPINLIQGQSGIDVATDTVKDIVKSPGFNRLSAMPTTSDNRSILARMRQLVLTLTGKENVGIVASAMKVFEAMSHHYNKVLSEGSLEEQQRLISNIKILGKKLPLIANSYTKNRDTLQSSKIEKAYDTVDNYKDAFIMMSALLSLATDNAKDPTLSKLNATPGTMGCYTAGLVLGLSVEDVATLLLSNTGILLSKLIQGNVFHPDGNSISKLSDAIRYLKQPPKEIDRDFDTYYELFGLKDPEDKEFNLTTALWSKRNRKKFKQMAQYLLHSGDFEFETDSKKIAKRMLEDVKSDPHYWTWNEEKEQEYKDSIGEKRDKLKKKFDEYNKLRELKESLDAYILDPESRKGEKAAKEIDSYLKAVEKSSKKSARKKAKEFMQADQGEVKKFLYSVFDWIRARETVENDKIVIKDKEYSILSEISKLNTFNEEMGDLRTVLKLNQGLPNSTQDQMSWVNSFNGILDRAIRRKNNKDSDLVKSFVSKYGSTSLDLNKFLNDPTYQQDAINVYEESKIGVNILDVMLGVPHYKGYLKTMNLLYEGGKAVSKVYDTQTQIISRIFPKLGLKNQDQINKFFKTLNPVIFKKINNNFLWQQQEEYEIPKFEIKNGELKESRDESGNLKFETIRLGTDLSNQKFRDYVIHYIYPYLKENYPDNAFVKSISLRTYGYNLDHQVTINLAKTQSFNMNNPAENVQFNEIKQGLVELNNKRGLVKALFYYNLIAYNGQPGQQALTDLFEDFLIYDNNQTISDYNKYITYLDASDVQLFDFDAEEDYLLQVFAPTVYFKDVTDNMRYAWITNPENNREVLLQHLGQLTEAEIAQLEASGAENNPEPERGYDDNEDHEPTQYYESYKTMDDIRKALKGKWDTVGVNNSVTNNKFILGKNTLLNPQIFDNVELSENEEAKKQFLKTNSDKILLSINGNSMSLKDILDIVGNEEDVFKAFQFVKRKSRNHTYEALIYSRLKHRLESLLNDNTKC